MRIFTALLIGVVIASCSDQNTLAPNRDLGVTQAAGDAPVARIRIDPWSIEVKVGVATQLNAYLWDAQGNPLTGRVITWSSNRPHVKVDAQGVVTAIDSGAVATVTATSEGQQALAAVRITGRSTTPTVPVASVSVSPTTATMLVGQTTQLTATARDASNNPLTGRTIAWSSSNPAVATVNSTGLVTATGQGGATITATSEGQSGAAAITVNIPAPSPVASVRVSPSADTLNVGQTTQLTATTRDANGNVLTGRAVTWSSSNAAVARVSTSGLVTAVAPGGAVITATSEGQSGSSAISVNAPAPTPVASVSVSPSADTLNVGQTTQLTATTRDANGNVLTGRAVTWSSSNAAVASVSTSGLVTAVAQGGAVITATSEGRSGSSAISVVVPPPTVATVTVTPSTASLQPGQTVQLTATARSADGTIIPGQTFTWTSGNNAVATVNANGVVSGIAAGSAIIRARTSGIAGRATVTVTEPPPPPPGDGQLLFHSDWRTRIGNSSDAISDGGKWDWMSSGAGENGSIIDAPAGFSTHKVLRVASNGHRDGWIAPTVTTLGTIPIGATRNFRWEHAFHEPAMADDGQHPIQDGGSVSQSNWYLGTTNGGSNLGSGQWGIDYIFGGNPSWLHDKFTLGSREGQYTPLQKGVVYRHEIQMVRVSATQFRFYVWIYDSAGNLLYDVDDFRNRDGSTSLRNYLHTFNVVANTSIFLIGLNGISAPVPWPVHSSDQAAIAIVQGLPEGQPIGPYGSVAGEVRR